MDEGIRELDNRPMGRTRFNVFAKPNARHYLIVWDLQWQVIDCRRLERGSDLRAALAEALERLASDGWRPQSTAKFGFVFVMRAEERRLVMITTRDPLNSTAQSFSPFRASRP